MKQDDPPDQKAKPYSAVKVPSCKLGQKGISGKADIYGKFRNVEENRRAARRRFQNIRNYYNCSLGVTHGGKSWHDVTLLPEVTDDCLAFRTNFF
jgi:hypothetical protein